MRETAEKVQHAGHITGQQPAGQQAVRIESASARNALLSRTTAVLGGTAAWGNLVTPMIMGQRLQLNPVAIFIALTFWVGCGGPPVLASPSPCR